MKSALSVITILCTCLFSFAHANTCAVDKMPVKPAIPAGVTATAKEMATARADVQRYMEQARNYLDCRVGTPRYDYYVSQVYRTADAYNSELKTFKQRLSDKG